MLGLLTEELRHHVPFTALGAGTGIVIMLAIALTGTLPQVNSVSETVFYILHPLHVAFSAIVITSLYLKYRPRGIITAVIWGWVISVGMATLSDSVIPYGTEALLSLPQRALHIGFLEE